MKSRIRYAFIVIAILAIAWGVYRHDSGEKVALAAVPPIPVTVAQVKAMDVPIELDGLGTVQAFNTVTVRPQVSGQIVRIAFKQGANVRKGDLLVQIDPRPFQAKLAEDEAAQASDRAHLANAEANLARYLPLELKGFSSAQQLDTQRAMVSQLRATLQGDAATISFDQLSLDYATITSPINGIAGFRLVDAGNVVSPTETQGLVTITQVQPIAVLFTLTQGDFPRIRSAMDMLKSGQLAAQAWSEDDTTLLDTGHLETLDNQIDPASGTIALRAVFTNRDELLWPGAFVDARLILSVLHDAMTVPSQAVQQGPEGSYVWCVLPARTAQVCPVRVGQLTGGTALILSGLDRNNIVVTDGQYGLKAGSHISIQKTQSGTPALQNAETETLGIQP